MPQMSIESFVSPLVLPVGVDLVCCVAEDGAKPVLYQDQIAELLFDSINTGLRDVSPNAQQVGEVDYFDFCHPTGHRVTRTRASINLTSSLALVPEQRFDLYQRSATSLSIAQSEICDVQ
jgi:hypothetical protein